MFRNKFGIKYPYNDKRLALAMLIVGSILFAWLTTIAVSPLNKSKQIRNIMLADSTFFNSFDSAYYHDSLKDFVKEKAYKEALLALSENDSIQLVINLSDSTVQLSIKGIAIHTTKIYEFSKDKFFEKLPIDQECKLFSQPLKIQSSYSTIEKEPIVVREAPKDSLEAALNAWEPDTLMQVPSFALFTVENNFQIILEQIENESIYDKIKKIGFYNHLRILKFKSSAKNFFTFKKQEYYPEIIIKMPVDDLRAVYRALPSNAHLVLKL